MKTPVEQIDSDFLYWANIHAIRSSKVKFR